MPCVVIINIMGKIMKHHKDCEGCAYDYDILICVPKQDGTCPCGTCIIKMMCGTPCQTWGQWYKSKGGV